MLSNYTPHVKRIIVVLVILAGLIYSIRWLLTPESFGKYGHYRADAILEEADRAPRHGTNASCLSCHEYEFENLTAGKHKNVSCEFCHGTYADHVGENKKIADLPVKEGEDLKVLCLRCHNHSIMARPKEVVKTIVMPDHLRDQQVRETHTCNQCHYVHAPLKYINRAKRIAGIQEEING